MMGFPQVRCVTTNDYVEEINNAIDSHNYLSALVLSLMLPDICSKYDEKSNYNDKEKKYIKWFNKYVYRKYFNFPGKREIKKVRNKEMYKIKFTGSTCYALRNAMMHSGNPYLEYKDKNLRIKTNVDYIELCVNGSSDRDMQHGGGASITRYNDETKSVSIRINVVIFAETMINGYRDFLSYIGKDNIKLFNMIDWDKVGGKIVFTPNK